MEHNTVCEWMDDLEYNILSVSIPDVCYPFTTRRDAVKEANKVDTIRYTSNVCMGTDNVDSEIGALLSTKGRAIIHDSILFSLSSNWLALIIG
jgi:hypothetical protein